MKTKDIYGLLSVFVVVTTIVFVAITGSRIPQVTLVSKEHLPPHIEVRSVFYGKVSRMESFDMPETYRFHFSDNTYNDVSPRTYDLYPVGQEKRTIPK